MIATETKCVDKCSNHCEPKETEVCKDVSVPFEVSKGSMQCALAAQLSGRQFDKAI